MSAAAPVTHAQSGFGSGIEGWTSSDGDAALEVANGHLVVKDITEDWHWVQAPAKFVGDWRGLSAVALRVRADADLPARHPIVLEIQGPGSRGRFEVHTRFVTPGRWREIRVPLRPAFWHVDGEWPALIADVRRFRIRLDLNAATDAMEVNALDDIRVIALHRSRFTRSKGGWTCLDGEVTQANGHLRVVDTGSGWCWLRAPEAFRGDWRRHGRVALRIRAGTAGTISQPLRIQIESPHGMAIFQFPLASLARDRWRSLSAPLDPSHWAVSGSWREIVRDVSDLWIRVDLTDAHGATEVAHVDDIELGD